MSRVSCAPGSSALSTAFDRIDRLLAETRERAEVPGMAAGIVCGDSLAFARAYGVRGIADPTPVTDRTLFRIASVTKVFTATAVVKLHERGALHLDDPVERHLPWFEIGRPRGSAVAPVTVRHLLTHTAGMPRDSRLTDFGRRFQPDRDEAVAALPDQRLTSSPGERYAYSNLGYAILGEVIAEAAGTTYARYLEREVLDPLGMRETLVHPLRDDPVTRGHGPRRPTVGRSESGFWELGFATPAGGMASSVAELSEFVRLQLAPYRGAEPSLLSAETLRAMHEVQFAVDPARGGSGLGWAVEISQGQHLVYHSGEMPEQTSVLLIDLDAQIGIVMLTNAQGVDVMGLAGEILRIVRGAVFGPGAPFPEVAIPPA